MGSLRFTVRLRNYGIAKLRENYGGGPVNTVIWPIPLTSGLRSAFQPESEIFTNFRRMLIDFANIYIFFQLQVFYFSTSVWQ